MILASAKFFSSIRIGAGGAEFFTLFDDHYGPRF